MAFSSQSFTAPKITKGNFSSPLSSGASKISGVTPKLSRSRIKFRTPKIKSPLVTAPPIDSSSLVVEEKPSIQSTLIETNSILVEIQKQLALDFAMRIAEEKEKNAVLKEERSARKFALKESAVESIKKIGGAIKSTVSKVAAPVKGFFDKLLEFITTLGLGVGANAVFQWLEKKENREKIDKFFKVVSANWKLIRNILGVIVAAGLALKVAGAVATIGSVLALLANPVVLGFLAGAGLMFGTAVAYDKIASDEAGGALYLKAHQELDKKMQQAGMTPQGNNLKRESVPMYGGGGGAGLGKELPLTESQIKVRDDVAEKRRQLRALQSARDAEIKGVTDELEKTKIRNKYEIQIPGIIGAKSPEARRMGGPVNAGQPYIVGERGPEFFIPNINGSVVNNYRTEKIYDMISSKNAGKINFITMDLPPQVIKKEKSIPTPPAPPVPVISPINASNPYMLKTPDIYGIYV